jgi:hypothetical protein
MVDEVEKRVLQTVWPIECESIGDEALISILTGDLAALKEVKLKDGNNLSVDQIYKLLTAGLGIIKQLKVQFKNFVSAGGKPDEFTIIDGKRKLVVVATSEAMRVAVGQEIPKIIEAFLLANNKQQ